MEYLQQLKMNGTTLVEAGVVKTALDLTREVIREWKRVRCFAVESPG
jgi:hypothetical protein